MEPGLKFLLFIVIIVILAISVYQFIAKPVMEAEQKVKDKKAAAEKTADEAVADKKIVVTPVNCVMSAWSACDNGTKTRTVTTPVAGTGTACGPTSEACSNCVIGNWSACAGGKQSRTITPASNGGTCTETTISQDCVSPIRTYSQFDNTSYTGYDITPSVPGTLEECKTKCDNKLNCTGFVMNNGADICYFKSAITDAQPNFDKGAKYYYTGTAPSKGKAKRDYIQLINTDGQSGIIREIDDNAGNTKISTCKTECDKNTECIGFSFYKNGYDFCVLHKQGVTLRGDNQFDYYYV